MMNVQQAQKLKPIIDAFAQKLPIQFREREGMSWVDIKEIDPEIPADCYRVKPEALLRPYESADEAFQEAQKHNFWVLAGDCYFQVTGITDREQIFLGGDDSVTGGHTFEEFSGFRWADDKTRCGIITME